MNNPTANDTTKSNSKLFYLVRPDPTCVPIGVIARSAPRLNKPIPKTKKSAEIVNTIVSFVLKETNGVIFNNTTIIVIGKMEISASFNL